MLGLLTEHDPEELLFLFLNISATHVPHHHYLPSGDGVDNWDSQYPALTYTDPTSGGALPEHGHCAGAAAQ